ncbi:dihydrofolate reductase family protein [Bacillus sp. B1-b2]|uniref:dihydrofolate reductase family protein n=1 Tax=Bacillus sp. B1-b2 TaxID=2653201 RepID=UPI001261657E|nr:dihydrofolate reductase family protein [Bacillus sp. B1-b2]KAB7665891.1 dihydrofolate reductase [Bacillus sp. B1-b2]
MSTNRNVVLFIACSLDGYIATKEDSLEWLFAVEGEGDNGFSAFYETIDTVMMGRKTYDWIMKQDTEEFPYLGKDCYVFTSNSKQDTDNITYVSGNPSSLVDSLKEQSGKKIWIVGGGELLHTFIQDNLIDEIIITVAPTILGDGIPLFKKGQHTLNLELVGTKTFNQFVELHYLVK